MLAGVMLETYAKAVLVANYKNPLAPDLMTHDLLRIVTSAGYFPTEEERDFFAQMTEFIRWTGKYPAPRDPDGLDGVPGMLSPDDDIRRAEQIADKLEALYAQAPHPEAKIAFPR